MVNNYRLTILNGKFNRFVIFCFEDVRFHLFLFYLLFIKAFLKNRHKLYQTCCMPHGLQNEFNK